MAGIPMCPEHQSQMREDFRRPSSAGWYGIKTVESETTHYVCRKPECEAWADVETQIPIKPM